MKKKIIHQWRDWHLEHISDNKYELIQKDNLSVVEIVAKNDMDAENQVKRSLKRLERKCFNTPLILELYGIVFIMDVKR